MRIGISTSTIQRGRTGIAQHLFALLRALRSHTSQHQFILFVLEEDLPLFDFLGGQMEVVIVPERYRPPVKNIVWHQAALPALARRRQLDVLHVPSYRRMVWRRACPRVATIHDLAPFRVPAKYDWKRMFYGRVVARQLAHRQDQLIAVSENTARDIISFFRIPSGRIAIVHNGIEHERFFPGSRAQAQAAVAEAFGLKRPFFLYLARLEHPGKNHTRLISAFEIFKSATNSDWQLVFGGSDWHGAQTIHAAIKRSPVASDIRALGFVSNEALPDLYRAAEVFVYPSLYEGFGLPPIEAMACGCPVVASTRGSLAEVVGAAAATVEPEDVPALARELFIVATDQSVRNRLRAAGLAQAQKFDWNRAATETLAAYARAKENWHGK
jgi:glycosyltransferase involved in cell wall biosynthesis